MPAVGPPGLERLDDVGAVLLRALFGDEPVRRSREPVREVRLEPVPPLPADAEIPARLAVGPAARVIEPLVDLLGILAVPRDVLGQVPVRFGGIVPEVLQHVDADLLGLREPFVRLVGREDPVRQVLAVVGDPDIPRLVVEPRRGDVDLALLEPERARDLCVTALHAVAEADRLHAAVLVRRPRHHGAGVGIGQENASGRGDLADVPAEIEDLRDPALTVHDAARREGIADALVHAVAQGDLDILLERLEHPDAHGVDDVFRAAEGLPAVEGRMDLNIQAVLVDVPLAEAVHHVEVLRVDVHEGHLDVVKFRDGEQVGEQAAGEAHAARADERDLEGHGKTPFG